METNFRLLYLHNELSVTFGRWRQRTVREVVHVGRWTQAASGTAGGLMLGFALHPLEHLAKSSNPPTVCVDRRDCIYLLPLSTYS